MFLWQITFFILALIAALYGLGAATPLASEVAKMLSLSFAILFLGAQLFRIGREADALKEEDAL